MIPSIAMLIGLSCITACERTARPQDAAPAADSAQILYDIGVRELALVAYDSASVAYMKARPEHFFYNSTHDFYAYNGYHFRELLRSNPHSELADDAAYQLTHLLSENLECEGWVPCYVHTEWDPIAGFLLAYPASPFADSALTRGLELFGRVLAPEVYREPYDYEIVEMRGLLASFDSVTRALPEPLRNRSDTASTQWRAWVEQSDD